MMSWRQLLNTGGEMSWQRCAALAMPDMQIDKMVTCSTGRCVTPDNINFLCKIVADVAQDALLIQKVAVGVPSVYQCDVKQRLSLRTVTSGCRMQALQIADALQLHVKHPPAAGCARPIASCRTPLSGV